MDLLNTTPMKAAYTLGLDHAGREHILVVVKGTFTMPTNGEVPKLSEEQRDLVLADTFTGEPGLSAVEYESEFALHKPACDVLLLGSAYAPDGRRTTSVPVMLQVGSMTKQFEVVGPRYWEAALGTGIAPSQPETFLSQTISYDCAFGGTECVRGSDTLVHAYEANPVGIGFARDLKDADMFGQSAPQTQETGVPIRSPRGKAYRPMSFGPLGRAFSERVRYAGTYNDTWLAEHFPFLPPDFDLRYFQAAPKDQQIAYPRGGEWVQMLNLTATRLAPFQLPSLELPVELTHRGSRTTPPVVVDTLLFEPERGQFQVVWRTSVPLQDSMREVAEVIIGRMPNAFYRARDAGKRYISMSRLHQLRRGDS
jgi:hypothetical protein